MDFEMERCILERRGRRVNSDEGKRLADRSFGKQHHSAGVKMHGEKTSIHPTKENQDNKKEQNSSLVGFYPLFKHVNPRLAAEKTITETSYSGL